MADKDFNIRIDTEADTTGAQQAEDALERVDRAADEATETTGTSGAERQIDELGDEAQQTAVQVESATRELTEFNTASSGTLAPANNAAAAVRGVGAAQTQTTNTSRNLGAGMQQAGFQIGDFAVQVGAGQNALVAFSQQGSQMLGMFGPGGAVAGAALAVGAAIFSSMSRGKEAADETGKSVEELQEELDKLAQHRRDVAAITIESAYEEELRLLKAQNTELERGIETLKRREKLVAEIEVGRIENEIAETQRAVEAGDIGEEAGAEKISALRQQKLQKELALQNRLGELNEKNLQVRIETARQQLELNRQQKEAAAAARDIVGGQTEALKDFKDSVEEFAERAGEIDLSTQGEQSAELDRAKLLNEIAKRSGLVGEDNQVTDFSLLTGKVVVDQQGLTAISDAISQRQAELQPALDANKQAAESAADDQRATQDEINSLNQELQNLRQTNEELVEERKIAAQEETDPEAAQSAAEKAVSESVQDFAAKAAEDFGSEAARELSEGLRRQPVNDRAARVPETFREGEDRDGLPKGMSRGGELPPVRSGSEVGGAPAAGSSEALQSIETEGAAAIEKVLGQILQGIGDAANQGPVAKQAEQIRQLLSDGLQPGDEDPLVRAVGEVVRQSQGNQMELRDLFLDFKSQLEDATDEIRKLKAQQGEVNQ